MKKEIRVTEELLKEIFNYVTKKKDFIILKKGNNYTDDYIDKNRYDEKLICSFEKGRKREEVKREIIESLFFGMNGYYYFQTNRKNKEGYDGIEGYFLSETNEYIIACFRIKNQALTSKKE